MPMAIAGNVGMPVTPAAGASLQMPRLDPLLTQVITEANGKYYEATRNNLIVTAITPAAGVALVSYGSTAIGFAVQNPAGSVKKAQLLRVTLGYVSGANTPGSVCYATNVLPGYPALGGTTATTTYNNNVQASGAPQTTVMQPIYTSTGATALQLFETTGMSTFTALATTATTPFVFRDDIDGRIVVNPGATFSVCGSVAGFGTYIVAITWIELPVAA